MDWISVNFTLPNKDEKILFTDGKRIYLGEYTTGSNNDEEVGFVDTSTIDPVYGYVIMKNITHWIRIPNISKDDSLTI